MKRLIDYDKLELDILNKLYYKDKSIQLCDSYKLYFMDNELCIELLYQVSNFNLLPTSNFKFKRIENNIYVILYVLHELEQLSGFTKTEKLFIECADNGNELVKESFPKELSEKISKL